MCSDVVEQATPLDRPRKRAAVSKITFDLFYRQAGEIAGVASLSRDHPDLDSGLYQRADDCAANKAGSTGDEHLHRND